MLGATCGVTVSTSAFLAYHQCYCEGSSLARGLNLRDLVCGVSDTRRQGFSPGTPVSSPPSSFNGSANEIKAQINTISTLSNSIAELSLRTTWHVTHVARDKRLTCCA